MAVSKWSGTGVEKLNILQLTLLYRCKMHMHVHVDLISSIARLDLAAFVFELNERKMLACAIAFLIDY